MKRDPFHMNLSIPVIKDWSGTDIPLSVSEKRFWQGTRVRKLLFYDEQGQKINVLFVDSKEDIHRLHAPEYCLMGSGWKIIRRNIQKIPIPGKDVLIQMIVAKRKHQTNIFYYWFSSNESSTPSYLALRHFYKYKSKQNWRLYQISTVGDSLSSEQLLNNFVKEGLLES